ncbi:MAG: TIGR04255 family protein [Anaerolineae bacterium]
MSLQFPEKTEIPLANPPLAEVICQVRYPPILRIAKEQPTKFQERIRQRFPEYGIEQPFKLSIPGAGAIGEPSAELPPRLLRFTSKDGHTTATLAVDFFALSTTRYRHWSNFVDDLMVVSKAVEATYRPAYASRIGLRYVNRLNRTTTGLDNIPDILGLVRPELIAVLHSEAWSDPEEWTSQLVLPDREGKLALRFVFNSTEAEPYFQLDFDYFEQGQVALSELRERVNRYHQVIYRAFRWCLSDRSLAVFGSRPIEVC